MFAASGEAVKLAKQRLPPGPCICVLGGHSAELSPAGEALVLATARQIAVILQGAAVILTCGVRCRVPEAFARGLGSAPPSLVRLVPECGTTGGGTSVGHDLVCGETPEECADIFGQIGEAYLLLGEEREAAGLVSPTLMRSAVVLPLRGEASEGSGADELVYLPPGSLEMMEEIVSDVQRSNLAAGLTNPEVAAATTVDLLLAALAAGGSEQLNPGPKHAQSDATGRRGADASGVGTASRRNGRCPRCNGRKVVAWTTVRADCAACRGTGTVGVFCRKGLGLVQVQCSYCNGRKEHEELQPTPCPECSTR